MEKDIIYLGNNPVNEKALCGLIIGHLSRNDENVKTNMIKYHMNEIKNVSKMLISALGGSYVEARAFNAYFYETVSSLGYTTGQLTTPVYTGIRQGVRVK